jgi:tRNA threonylcarbamoyl adenosine modification protein (Sua5/YciO/YrdC/YwlC family)
MSLQVRQKQLRNKYMVASSLKIHPDNPPANKIKQVIEVLKKGGVIIYPTDTVYAMGCDISQPKAIERICRIKNIDPAKHAFSILCHDISQLSSYTKQLSNVAFKLVKKKLPGPHTFILPIGGDLPKSLYSKKKTIGIRVPDHPIINALVSQLGNPLLTTSIKHTDEILEYMTDPEEIFEQYKNLVDLVIDGGAGDNIPSTVWDCTSDDIILLREGKGNTNY